MNFDVFTFHIHLQGQVQGVGFRPFVFKLAQQLGLKGWVNNTTDGVHIEVNGSKKEIIFFLDSILKNAPPLSKIIHHSIQVVDNQLFESFKIVHSEPKIVKNLLLPPDFAVCNTCKNEIKDKKNFRFNYAFTTCLACGPRFSIIQKLPYDRPNTTMQPFAMCPTCTQEYDEPLDRRYYSQTNSCPTCGILMQVFDNQGVRVATKDPITFVVEVLEMGKIVAIKGIGGYLLLCDATHRTAITTLRQRKHRPTKPFAVMFSDLEALKQGATVSQQAAAALESPVAPIVLVDWQPEKSDNLAADLIAPNLRQLGAMLPYTPLYTLIMEAFGKPMVATSGNISHAPIVFEDEKALADLASVADFIVTNDRAIALPQDDSVVRFSPFFDQKTILRRSRGLAPTYLNPFVSPTNATILSVGSDLKSAFCLQHEGNFYISPYLGDLQSFDTQQHFRHALNHFCHLLDASPTEVLCDAHPLYFSASIAAQVADNQGVSLKKIQHHEAHFAAVLAENGALEASEKVLGVIWDGTGYGHDGQIWGGEFLVARGGHQIERAAHFAYFDVILNDKMSLEPRLSALSLTASSPDGEAFMKPKFTAAEWSLYQKMLSKGSPIQTSSVGRLFDAVASLLGLADKTTFEGEAGMYLESLAMDFFWCNGLIIKDLYEISILKKPLGLQIDTRVLIQHILKDLKQEKRKEWIAAKFHFSMIKTIEKVANLLNINQLAFSGGVFQNVLLIDLIKENLKENYTLYFHKELSPNDESIAFGQLMHHLNFK